jgi:hypothetical protein
LRPPFGLTIAPATYLGGLLLLLVSWGCWYWYPRGGRKNKTGNRRTSATARKKKYVRIADILLFFYKCVFGRFSARGVRKHEKKNEYVSKKLAREIFFRGGISRFFFLSTFLLRWLSASR